MSFTVRVALPADYAEAGLVTAQGYHADDLLRRPDGLIDADYEARLTDAGRRAREADLLVAIDDGRVLGWQWPQADAGEALAARSSRRVWIGPERKACARC